MISEKANGDRYTCRIEWTEWQIPCREHILTAVICRERIKSSRIYHSLEMFNDLHIKHNRFAFGGNRYAKDEDGHDGILDKYSPTITWKRPGQLR